MYNIGDIVKEKGKQRLLEIINIVEDVLVLKELNTNKVNIVMFRANQIEKCFEEKTKTNVISKISKQGNESLVEYNINEDTINFKVTKNPIDLSTALKIILYETKLYDYKYERICPFRIIRRYSSETRIHTFNLEFIETQNFKRKTIELINADKDLRIKGCFNLFIPDFLELCSYENILRRFGNGYKVSKKLYDSIENCTYANLESKAQQLKKEGFMIPKKFYSK